MTQLVVPRVVLLDDEEPFEVGHPPLFGGAGASVGGGGAPATVVVVTLTGGLGRGAPALHAYTE
jgi:hypothetical protein